MRLLLVTADFPPKVGGVATWSMRLVKNTMDAGHSVTVLTSVACRPGSRDFGLRVVRTPGLLDLKFIKVLPLTVVGIMLCLKSRPSRMILMTWAHEGITGIILRRLFRVQYVLVAHGAEILSALGNPRRKWLMCYVFRHAAKVIANSEFTRGLVLDLGISREKTIVLHPSADIDVPKRTMSDAEVRTRHGLQGKRVILTVARLVARKGHDDVIRAVATLKDRYPDLIYAIAGIGERRRMLEDLCKDLGVQDRVLVLGYVPNEELDALYRACDIFVMPARHDGLDVEGFGIAFVEAALRGKALIGGRTGGVPDIVLDGETGYLVEPGNVPELTEQIRVLLDDSDLRHRIGEQARWRALQQFSPASQLGRLRLALEGD